MLKEVQESAKHELGPELGMMQHKLDNLCEEYEKGNALCAGHRQKLEKAYDSLDKVEADLRKAKEKVLSLTEKLASANEELAAVRTAAKGKGPDRDPLERDPKRARTAVSYADIAPPMGDVDVPMNSEEGYPPLPPAGVSQQNPDASLRHKRTFVETVLAPPTRVSL
jgi:exonuclease VII small subunit